MSRERDPRAIDPAELKALVEKATPGLWVFERNDDPASSGNNCVGWLKTPKKRGYPNGEYIENLHSNEDNARLIALAPTLARQVLALSEEVTRMKGNEVGASAAIEAGGQIADMYLKRATAAEAEAKALRQRLGEIREAIGRVLQPGNGMGLLNTFRDDLDRIAALAAIQEGEGK